MKKRLAVCVFLAAISVLMINLLAGEEYRYADIKITQEEMQEITGSRAVAQDALFTKILFNEYELMHDMAGNRLFYSLIENSSDAQNPYVECVSERSDVQMAIVGGEITYEAIANGEGAGILLYTEKEYQYISLVLTTLPLMSVEYEDEMPEEGAIPFRMKLFDNRRYATQRLTDGEGEIRIRGRYSRNFPKDGYRMTLYEDSVGEHRRERNASLLGMRQDGDWLLYAAYNDHEKIRNVFSSNLWKLSCASNNSCGVDNGMEYKYVELFINGQYWGLYALGYPMDPSQFQLSEGEYVYKKTDPYQAETGIDFTAEGPVPGYEIKELGTNEEESWESLKEYYSAMLYENGDYSKLREMTDIENSIDIFLFINMIQGIDHANLRGENIIHNFYMTNKVSADKTTEVMLYTPWDMDRAWGNGFGDESYNVTPDQNVFMQTNIVYLLLQQGDQEMTDMVVQRYMELRESTWSDAYLLQLLNTYESQIFQSGAFRRDQARWPEGRYINEQHKLNLFKGYVLERMKYMDAFIGQYV